MSGTRGWAWMFGMVLFLLGLGLFSGCATYTSATDSGLDSNGVDAADADGGGNGDISGDKGADSSGDKGTDGGGDKGSDGGFPSDKDQGDPCAADGGCATGASCCSGYCSNTSYDPENCGGCGKPCPAGNPFCEGSCTKTPCTVACPTFDTCCGKNCCQSGQVCCVVNRGGPVGGPDCYWGHCPEGCPTCL